MRGWWRAAAALLVMVSVAVVARAEGPVLSPQVYLPQVVQGEPVLRVPVEAWGNPDSGATWTAGRRGQRGDVDSD